MTPLDAGTHYVNRIDSRETLLNALDSLVTDSCRAFDHWKLLLHLNESSNKYLSEMSHTPFFWNTILRSLQDGVMLRIATMLDPREDVVSVPSVLRIIKTGQGNGSTLGIELPDFEKVKIEDDLKKVHKIDPIVAKVLKIRNDFIAHRSVNLVATRRIDLLPEIKNDEITSILDLVYALATKYSMLYGRHMTARWMAGWDDYQLVLQGLRKGYNFEGV